MTDYIDYLNEDVIRVPGQNFALLSKVSPDGPQKNTDCGIKIRGVFSNKEEAGAWAQKLQKTDSTFDIYVVDMYKWLPVFIENDDIEDQEFTEKRLNDIVKGHKEQQILSKQFFDERKMEQMEDAMKKVKESEQGSSSQDTFEELVDTDEDGKLIQ